MFHNVQGKCRAVNGLQLILAFSWSSMHWDDENHTVCYDQNVEDPA